MVHTISNFAGLSIEAFLNDKVILKSYDEVEEFLKDLEIKYHQPLLRKDSCTIQRYNKGSNVC